MTRRSNGQVLTRKNQARNRLRAPLLRWRERHYATLGTAEEGWNQHRAEDELAATMAAVRAGSWQPSRPTAPVDRPKPAQTFHEFASDWRSNREPELRPKTIKDYRWALSHHLLPYFAAMEVAAITPANIDGYKAAKLSEGTIAGPQINKTLRLLAQILDVAGEYGLLTSANPARGRRRRGQGRTSLSS